MTVEQYDQLFLLIFVASMTVVFGLGMIKGGQR